MFILYYLLWIILNGRITAEILLFGIPVSGLISFVTYRVVGYSTENDRKIVRNLPLLLRYLITLIKEIAKAAISVMGVVAKPGERPEPVIVEFRSGLPTRFQNVLLANSITLTPGTYTLFLDGDRFVIHCLRREYADGLDSSPFVQLLRKMV
ncbi:MAG: Na+/H+ antiporter subunit E [Lachnospiraceae bacterium]|nr:Na+/H+ antiporter subunit E [Lachnospiraceae bacterium]